MKYFLLQVGEKPNWSRNLIDYPQPTSHVCWNPNCPLVKRKKKMTSTSKLTFYQFQTLLCMYWRSLFICAKEGAATDRSRALPCGLFGRPRPPPPLADCVPVGFPAQPVDCSPPTSPGGGAGARGRPPGEGTGPRSAAGPGLPGVRQAFWQVRN